MNSINKNQPEDNHKDLQSTKAIEKIKDLAEKTSTCFFCTGLATGRSNAARPMSVQKVDDNGILWFLSATDSHTNAEIMADPLVNLYFQGSAHSDFMHLQCTASISRR
jgi:general stress protein 26